MSVRMDLTSLEEAAREHELPRTTLNTMSPGCCEICTVCLPLTTLTVTFVGSQSYKPLYTHGREPRDMMVLVAIEIDDRIHT